VNGQAQQVDGQWLVEVQGGHACGGVVADGGQGCHQVDLIAVAERIVAATGQQSIIGRQRLL